MKFWLGFLSLLSVTLVLSFSEASLAEVKSPADLRAQSGELQTGSTYSITCWQQGVRLFENKGVGRVTVSKKLQELALSISGGEKTGKSVSVVFPSTAVCRLESRGR